MIKKGLKKGNIKKVMYIGLIFRERYQKKEEISGV